jgi:hypothetical protein
MPTYVNGRTLRERLFSGLVIDPVTGCLLWTRTMTDGYGYISVNGEDRRVHVVMWGMFEGPVPEGLELDHCACPHRHCASIAHLEPVTHRENMRRGKSAQSKACLRCGMPYDKANTAIRRKKSGGTQRQCRACSRRHSQEYRQRQKQGQI